MGRYCQTAGGDFPCAAPVRSRPPKQRFVTTPLLPFLLAVALLLSALPFHDAEGATKKRNPYRSSAKKGDQKIPVNSAEWLLLAGTPHNDFGKGVATDADGNIYMVGYTEANLDAQKNKGEFDAFLIKYDTTGRKLWTKLFGTERDDFALGVAVDEPGNVYVTGFTYGPLDGNEYEGNGDIFVSKFSSSGERQWTRLYGTPSGEEARSVAVDPKGNVYVAGHSGGEATGVAYAKSRYNWDIVVLKYDTDGNREWFTFLGTDATYDYSYGIAVDSHGNSFITGSTNGNLAGNKNNGESDAFVAKLDTGGETAWVRLVGTEKSEDGKAIAVDWLGNAYLTGTSRGHLDGHPNAGFSDIFIAKFDTEGEQVWSSLIGSEKYDYGFGIDVDAKSNVYVTGSIGGPMQGHRYQGNDDIATLMLNGDGELLWIKSLGRGSAERGYGVAMDMNDNLFVVGETGGDLEGNENKGKSDAFIWKRRLDTKPPVTTVSLAEGAYREPRELELTCNDADGWGCTQTFYTTDEYLTASSWNRYAGPIEIPANTTLQFYSVDEAKNSETAKTVVYRIDDVPPTLVATPGGDTYNRTQMVELACEDDNSGCAGIYYTTDGTEPDIGSTVYGGPVQISDDLTLKFMAVDHAGNKGRVYAETYAMDRVAPDFPVVNGSSPSNSPTPEWTWTSAGGNGTFRYKLDDANLDADSTETGETSYKPDEPLEDGLHALYVQERDDAGNWSASGSTEIMIDTTPPAPPIVTGPDITDSSWPIWSWSSGGGGSGVYRYSLTVEALETAERTYDTSYKPERGLTDGPYTLYVQERDDAGNWSLPGALTVVVSSVPPSDTSISIHAKTDTTTERYVTVVLTAKDKVGITGYYLAENPTPPEPEEFKKVFLTNDFSAHIPYTLSPLPGVKVVYAWFKNAGGKVSPRVSRTIKLVATAEETPAHAYQWVRLLGTSGDESSYGITVDPNGNVYITGHTEGDLEGNKNAGGLDIFLAKYDTNGKRLWTKLFGTDSYDYGLDIAVDTRGNVYLTGNTEGNLGGNRNSGGSDIFVSKFGPHGEPLWTKLLGTERDDYGLGIDVDDRGNVYITGNTQRTDERGLHTEVIVAKYDTGGTPQWSKLLGSGRDETGYGIAVAPGGNVYISGQTEGSLEGNENAGGMDAFAACYDNSGNLEWVKQFGGEGDETAYDVAIDAAENVYLTGSAESALAGSENVGGTDLFAAKYNALGEPLWLKTVGSPSDDTGYAIGVNIRDEVFVTGNSRGSIDDGQNAGNLDIFLIGFDADGNKLWTKLLGTPERDLSLDMAVDANAHIYITGHTAGGLDGNVNYGRTDVLIIKF